LGRKVRSAARLSLMNTMVMRLGNFATGIVLARFALGPAAWGVYGIAQTVLLVLLSANELGVGLAIVRWDGDPRRFAPTVLTLSAASSTLLYAALFAAAPAVAGVLGSPDAAGVLRVMCLSVVLDGLAQVPNGFLTRDFAQGRRMLLDALNFVLSTAVTLLLAFRGWGAMSFAVGAVLGNVAGLIGSCLAAPGTLRFGWRSDQARALLRFGLPLAGASMLALAVVNVDTLVVGSTLGKAWLGFYVLAFNISGWPVRIISEAARRVSFAGFSRLAADPRTLAQGFSRALGILMTGTVPLCVLLGVLAGPVIELLYGSQWSPAAKALPWLMALGLARIGSELAYDCLVAAGQRRSLIAAQGLWLVALVPVLIAAAHHGGIVGVAQGHVLVAGGLVVPVFLIALRRAGIGPRWIGRACARPFAGGAVMAAVLVGLQRPLGDSRPALLAAGAAGLAAYALCVLPGRSPLRGALSPGAASTDTKPS
jgi:PST family polysaccharide transporter